MYISEVFPDRIHDEVYSKFPGLRAWVQELQVDYHSSVESDESQNQAFDLAATTLAELMRVPNDDNESGSDGLAAELYEQVYCISLMTMMQYLIRNLNVASASQDENMALFKKTLVWERLKDVITEVPQGIFAEIVWRYAINILAEYSQDQAGDLTYHDSVSIYAVTSRLSDSIYTNDVSARNVYSDGGTLDDAGEYINWEKQRNEESE